jgi:hypothetical protein
MSETRPPYEKLDACEDYGNSHITGHPVWVMFTVRTRRDGKCPDGCDAYAEIDKLENKDGFVEFEVQSLNISYDTNRVYLLEEREIPYNLRTQITRCWECGILFT